MEAFKFKKVIFKVDTDVMEEFNERFGSIANEKFLKQKYRNEVVSFTKLKKKKEAGEDVVYKPEMDKFACPDYEDKKSLFQAFVYWVDQNREKKRAIGRLYCPYTHQVIFEMPFPNLDNYLGKSHDYSESYYYSKSASEVKVKDVFKIKASNNPLMNMSQEALVLFFSYWSYDVTDKVSFKDAKDRNLLEVNQEYGTLYYGWGTETWSNQMYFGPKGFFVKMKSERVYIPTPSYVELEDDLAILDKGGTLVLNKHRLPSLDERIKQAIEFGVLDKSLTPKKEADKAILVQTFKRWIDDIKDDFDVNDVYERIRETILNEEN